MQELEILTVPDPRLQEKALPVEKVDKGIRKLMDQMLETMAIKGIGLAATQVGIQKRVVVIDLGDHPDSLGKPLLMANPELLWTSSEMRAMEEGCLSIPDYYEEVTRPAEVQVSYLDENNEKQQLQATGLLATCIQHEIDHLNGVLFIDHLSALKRNLILKKIRKNTSHSIL